ncbi:hypothetical protein DCCM_3238 [Desulfocucumis palustris]|uniref:Uncharacterized protein n=1 Tax=Desulfocucumis palustris TaxID=1898651 RepID=A0A2L2XIR2_9FIRM|nr:hypothetical protein [Desulfocucumis palustris]GBF34126.1 hypothetical protein DCCM_3238 [Desulfocucumis palustris]
MNDPFETGIPKYSTAQSIYDALCELTQTEEMGILGEMFADVSYDGQDYYYTDKGAVLKEKFEKLSDYGNKMWLMDLAVWQIDQDGYIEIHDIVYDALIDSDLAKRIGFKKLFIDKMLNGYKSDYKEIIEEYAAELGKLNRFNDFEMIGAFNRVMQARGKTVYGITYPTFAYYMAEKVRGLQLQNETRLIAECRALLTSYDDFMLGLRMNQSLYTRLEGQYKTKALQLQASYEDMVRRILLAAKDQGIVFEPVEAIKMLPE